MKVVRVDQTGEEFTSFTQLAKFIGCAPSNITWHYQKNSDEDNHFIIGDYSITILKQSSVDLEKRKQKQKRYYALHRDYYLKAAQEWRKNNKERFKVNKERWRQNNKEWFNAYYREYRKKKKEQQ